MNLRIFIIFPVMTFFAANSQAQTPDSHLSPATQPTAQYGTTKGRAAVTAGAKAQSVLQDVVHKREAIDAIESAIAKAERDEATGLRKIKISDILSNSGLTVGAATAAGVGIGGSAFTINWATTRAGGRALKSGVVKKMGNPYLMSAAALAGFAAAGGLFKMSSDVKRDGEATLLLTEKQLDDLAPQLAVQKVELAQREEFLKTVLAANTGDDE